MGGDGRTFGDVPHGPSELLDEVGVAVGVLDDGAHGGVLEGDTSSPRRFHERLGGGLRRKGSDLRELEEPLRVGLGIAGQSGQLRQPRARERDRQLSLDRPVDCADERLELDLGQELPLIEEERDAAVPFPCSSAQRLEDIGEVVVQVSRVCQAVLDIDVESAGQVAIGLDGQPERLDDPGRRLCPRPPPGPRGDAEQRASGQVGQLRSERRVLGDLSVDGDPVLRGGNRLVLPQQHRLANPAQTGDDDRLLGPAPAEPTQQDAEVIDLGPPPSEVPGWCPRVGRVGVARSLHADDLD